MILLNLSSNMKRGSILTTFTLVNVFIPGACSDFKLSPIFVTGISLPLFCADKKLNDLPTFRRKNIIRTVE